ncbi:TonB-dependent siderophore receptor [Paenalcaligenes niemegkensis]|uniref:TonB-dependent siderophore receptor n=1 Tax=Paenalcaligenes niemegkensis TaxID=2895469 RepID=UPI001EE83B00|nr:TonB-dependent siderophore receptor [Paenalcaligenes niemegkensis]MCQ9617543.1 TonB-dependent siderophore receptor [Paenalcaligenes niemegkensis]
MTMGATAPTHAQSAEDAAQLSPVTVTGSSDEAIGYVAEQTSTATKTDTPLIEVPQSISIITEDQIREQGAQTLNQVLRYTSGVAPETRGATASRLDQFTVRGFSATTLLDGLRVFGSRDALPQVDAYRLQQVDVLKGPSSVMFGQGGPGGVVNQISKRPTADARNEVELQAGNFDYRRANFDFSGPFDESGQFLYRLTGSGYMSDGQLNETKERRYFIAPSFTWQPSADTRLTLLANLQRDPHMGSYGSLPRVRTLVDAPDGHKLGPDFYDGDAGFEVSDRRNHSVGYDFEHRFNDAFTVRSNARYLHAEGIYRSVYSNGYVDGSNNNLLTRSKGGTDVTMDTYAIDNHAQGKFSTGAIEHTLLAGVDFAHLNSDTLSSSFDAAPPLDIFNPDYHQNIGSLNWISDTNQRQYQTGVYLQDQIKIDRFSVLLGGRYDWSRTLSNGTNLTTSAPTSSATRAEAFTGRVGFIYNFDNGIAPYVSYAESFEPQSGTDANNKPFDALEGEQYEVGVKFQPPGTKSLYSVAAFDTRRKNMLTTIPGCVGSGCQEQTGELRTQGLELEARGEFARGLSVIANYSYIANEYTKDNATPSRPSLEGTTPYGIPKHQASLWGRYQWQSGPLAGLSLAAGARYLGSNSGGTHNAFKVPAATLVDTALDYDLERANPALKGMTVALNVNNLFNKEYVASCYSEDWCWYGYQRSIRASLRYRW